MRRGLMGGKRNGSDPILGFYPHLKHTNSTQSVAACSGPVRAPLLAPQIDTLI